MLVELINKAKCAFDFKGGSISKNREQRIALTSITGLVARVVNVLSGLLTIPLTLPYLGVEQFGIWMAVTGFVAFLSFADFGLSIGLQSRLTASVAKGDKVSPKGYLSTTLCIILVLALLISTLSYYVIPTLELTKLIGLENNENYPILELTVQVVIYLFSIGMFGAVIQRTYEALQEGYYSNIYLIVGRLLGLGSIFIAIELELSLPVIVALYMGGPTVALLLSGFPLLLKRKWLRPSLLSINTKKIKE